MSDLVELIVPTGIGDTLWSLTKAQAILDEENRLSDGRYVGVRLLVCSAQPTPTRLERRAFDFLRMFRFVRDVTTVQHEVLTPAKILETDGYIYAPSGRLGGPGAPYRLFANHALERGVRLEEWLPEFATDFDVLDTLKLPADRHRHPRPYFVVYTSQLAFSMGGFGYNWRDAEHPSCWTPQSCVDLVRDLLERHPGHDCLLVGAEYDCSMAELVESGVRNVSAAGSRIRNLCGQRTVPETIHTLRSARFVVGYPSGIPILATYLRRPTVIIFHSNPILRLSSGGRVERLLMTPGFMTSWVPPECVGRTYDFARAGRHGPADVADLVDRVLKRTDT